MTCLCNRGTISNGKHLIYVDTCLDLVFESVLTVHQKLVQVKRLIRDCEVDDLLELVRAVKVEDLGRPVVLHGDLVQEDLDDGPKKLPGLGVCLLRIACLANWPQL